MVRQMSSRTRQLRSVISCIKSLSAATLDDVFSDVYVVAEGCRGAAVALLDGRASEADEGGVGQGVAQVAGEAVYEVVLAAVLLIGDEDDVAPGGTFDWEPASLGDDDRDPEAIVRGVAENTLRRWPRRGRWRATSGRTRSVARRGRGRGRGGF